MGQLAVIERRLLEHGEALKDAVSYFISFVIIRNMWLHLLKFNCTRTVVDTPKHTGINDKP